MEIGAGIGVFWFGSLGLTPAIILRPADRGEERERGTDRASKYEAGVFQSLAVANPETGGPWWG